MKLVLMCTAVALLMSAVELAGPARRKRNTNVQIYRQAKFPVPQSELNVYFGDIEVTAGMNLTRAEAKYPPTIEFDFESSCCYTLIVLSPDWPSSRYPYLGASLLGLFINICGNSEGVVTLEDVCEALRWFAPHPPPYTGIHRYFIYLYEQNEMIDHQTLLRLRCNRVQFSLSNFVRTHNLTSPPIAGTMFNSQFRDCTKL